MKVDLYDQRVREVVERAIDEIRIILDEKLQDEFQSFVSGRSSTAAAATKATGTKKTKRKGAAKKAAAPKKPRKKSAKRVPTADVASAAMTFLREDGGPVNMGQLAVATGYPMAKLRRALVGLVDDGLVSKDGKARAVKYSAASGEPRKKKAAPKKKVAAKKKRTPRKKVAAKKKAAPKE